MKKLNLNLKKLQIGIAAVIILVILAIIIMMVKTRTPKEEAVKTYSYSNVAEQVLADEVFIYLHNTGLGDVISVEMGNEAVKIYRNIIRSNVDAVNNGHTQAIQEQIEIAMEKYATEYDEDLSAEDTAALSAGITELIWQSILTQIESVTEDVEMSEYFYLVESLEQQIQELEDRKMKVSINANIKNNTELTAEELLSMVNGMTDEEIEALVKSMGLSLEDLQRLLGSYQSDSSKEIDKEIDSKLEEELNALKKELKKELSGTEGNDGKDGKDGKNGKDGSNGKNGEDGEDGKDGKTTYIAYADDMNGSGFSLTPTETSKYVGTCITSDSVQPKNYASYSNWQIYRTYIITTTTDENNVTTVHIN